MKFVFLAVLVLAQSLPQATVDRQRIIYLQSQLKNPDITDSTRRELQMKIIELQHRIDVGPQIEPMPLLTPDVDVAPLARPYIPIRLHAPTLCDDERVAIASLEARIRDPKLPTIERGYDLARVTELRDALKSCH